MSVVLIQLFGFMLVTFGLGLLLGWVIWRYDDGTAPTQDSHETELEFWRSNLEQCRFKLNNEQNKVETLREEKARLKRRLEALSK
ncbi:hypothetical protein [Loktanella sp. S4079]|uniref:hypothetical protein n=1 Tax=Loktanella sp. S4079 TaxID=579483 RepID=UPI0005FA7525|nr:hypothetical protein [Loktanella sp. S4079]KJZ17867.1 hypothetical protein TW80_16645 [Loktanella sp. S4079]